MRVLFRACILTLMCCWCLGVIRQLAKDEKRTWWDYQIIVLHAVALVLICCMGLTISLSTYVAFFLLC